MSRAVARAATAGWVGFVTANLTAAPAFAADPLGPSEGADPGTALGTGSALLLYVVGPLTLLLLIAAIVWLPGVRAGRYRPQRGWSASPVWFAGPPDPVAAVQDAHVGETARGGASGSW